MVQEQKCTENEMGNKAINNTCQIQKMPRDTPKPNQIKQASKEDSQREPKDGQVLKLIVCKVNTQSWIMFLCASSGNWKSIKSTHYISVKYEASHGNECQVQSKPQFPKLQMAVHISRYELKLVFTISGSYMKASLLRNLWSQFPFAERSHFLDF